MMRKMKMTLMPRMVPLVVEGSHYLNVLFDPPV